MKLQKIIGGAAAATMLAAGLIVGASAPALALGNCGSIKRIGESPSYLAVTCSGAVKVHWKCSSDAFGTLNSRSFNYATSTYIKFKACDSGKATDYNWTNA